MQSLTHSLTKTHFRLSICLSVQPNPMQCNAMIRTVMIAIAHDNDHDDDNDHDNDN